MASLDSYYKSFLAHQETMKTPEQRAWEATENAMSPENRGQGEGSPMGADTARIVQSWMATLTPAQQQEYVKLAQQASDKQKRSFGGRLGSFLKVAVPLAVGGAGLAATGALGAAAQGFVGGAPLASAAVPAAVSSLTPEIAAAMAGAGDAGAGIAAASPILETGLGAGAITGGSGSMVPGVGAIAPAAAAPSGIGSLTSGLAGPAASTLTTGLGAASDIGGMLKDYGPLIAAGAGVANSALNSPDLPASPDYNALLDKQTAAQNELYDKLLNAQRVNQIGPDGSQTWSEQNGQWTLNTTLSPEQQRLKEQQTALSDSLLKNASGALGTPMDISNIPGMNYGTVDEFGNPNYNQTVADAYYDRGTRYLDPQIAQDQTALESRLGAQGFVPGTPAYDRAMENFYDAKNRTYGDVRDFATTQGFTTGLQNAQFGNQARQQSIAEALTLRNQPLNELNSFRTGSQVQTPSGTAQYSTPNQSAPDVLGTAGLNYNANLGQYNAGVAQNNQTTNNLFGLAGTLMNGKYDLFSGLGKKP